VSRFFEVLLVDYVSHGTRLSDTAVVAPPRSSAKVIDLTSARRRRRAGASA
jgi:hypothetical protein